MLDKMKIKLSRWLCRSAGGDWNAVNRDILGFVNPKDIPPVPHERVVPFANSAKAILNDDAFRYALDWLRLEQGSRYLFQSDEKKRDCQQAHMLGIEDVVKSIKKLSNGK
jgi:hypothetical protein